MNTQENFAGAPADMLNGALSEAGLTSDNYSENLATDMSQLANSHDSYVQDEETGLYFYETPGVRTRSISESEATKQAEFEVELAAACAADPELALAMEEMYEL